MELEFQRHWRGFLPGGIGDIPDGAANVLIRRGVAVERPKPKRRRRKPLLDDVTRRRKPLIDDVPEGVETV